MKINGMPSQAAPVERNLIGAAAYTGDSAGADASFDWGSILGVAKTVLPAVLGAL